MNTTEPASLSDILLLDTRENLEKSNKIEAKVLPIYDENFWMLHYEIPEVDVDSEDPYLKEILKSLELTRKEYNAVGLSANQVGIALRAFVIGTEDVNITCVNPKVLEYSGDFLKDNEGCMSFPGLYLKVSRPSWVEVEYTDEYGRKQSHRLHGLTARCFLHELDHLNGKVFTKHVGSVSLDVARRKQKKLVRSIKKFY